MSIDPEKQEEFPSNHSLMPRSWWRILKLKVRPESYAWLKCAAVEVNQVFNYCNEVSFLAATRTDSRRKLLSGFDLCSLTAGATKYFKCIGADTIQRICVEYAQKRAHVKRRRLRWRISHGSGRSLGWVPFKAESLKRKKRALRFCGKTFRVFETDRLAGKKWKQGCFAQDAIGDWWVCLSVEETPKQSKALRESVGIDLGLREIAVTSDGERLQAGNFFRGTESRIARAQRCGHKRQAKRLHRRVARCRADALHKFSRKIIDQYQNIVIGDVSTSKLARTWMAKSVHDAGWGMLRRMLQYKGEHAGRSVSVVNERNTTRTCSDCGALTGPSGLNTLVVRRWECLECGSKHDRDINAARNILIAGLRCRASVRGNEPSHDTLSVEPDVSIRVRHI